MQKKRRNKHEERQCEKTSWLYLNKMHTNVSVVYLLINGGGSISSKVCREVVEKIIAR